MVSELVRYLRRNNISPIVGVLSFAIGFLIGFLIVLGLRVIFWF